VIAYKFLTADGRGLFTRFAWPLPKGVPGDWVEAEIDPCRSGVHACRVVDLPHWVASSLYEIELDGAVVEHSLKLVAERGRLLRRVEAWNDDLRDEYSRMCIARAADLAGADERLRAWVPPADATSAGPALIGFIAARVAEELGGVAAYDEERRRQADWLRERLGLAG
jgi:hypothetical protein